MHIPTWVVRRQERRTYTISATITFLFARTQEHLEPYALTV